MVLEYFALQLLLILAFASLNEKRLHLLRFLEGDACDQGT